MIRVEIIANHSVEDNILEALAQEGAGKHYTRFPGVFGVGRQGPRMGDAIWPEENFALVIWCDSAEAAAIERAVKSVKAQFPGEGVKLFGLPDPAALQLPPPVSGGAAAGAPGFVAQADNTGAAAPAAPAGTASSSGTAPGAASAADTGAGAPASAARPAPPAPRPDFGGESF